MKWIVSIVVFSFCLVGFSQNNSLHVANVTKNSENERLYSFNHGVEYFPQLEERLKNHSNRNREIIIELTTRNGECVVLIAADITEAEVHNTLMFLVNGLGYVSYVFVMD